MAHEQKPSRFHAQLLVEAKALLRHLGWADADLEAEEHAMVVKEVVESLVQAANMGRKEGLDKGHAQGWADLKKEMRACRCLED